MQQRLSFLSLVGAMLAGGCGRPQPGPVTGASPTTPIGSVDSKRTEQPSTRLRIDEVAAELLRRINAKDGPSVVALYDASMSESFPVEKTGPFVRGLIDAKGNISKLSREDGAGDEHHGVYRFEAERGDWRVDLYVDDVGKVAGLEIVEQGTERPVANRSTEPAVSRSSIDLGLPYRGQWSVFWGGDKREVNAHIDSPSQRRAVDLAVLGPDGRTFRGDGKANRDYYAYGREVLAVADGVVVTAVDGVPENQPGELNPAFVPGNLVVVKHAPDLFSAYAHLEPGKIRVKVGTSVKRGSVLGLCGNSGNSSEPHLHFQLQDAPQFERSWGVEAVFKEVLVVRDGKTGTIADYTFLKGDLVGQPEKK